MPPKMINRETLLEFIQSKGSSIGIKNAKNVMEILTEVSKYTSIEGDPIDNEPNDDYSTPGYYYERLWDICIKLGLTNLTLKPLNGKLQQTYHLIKGNPNSQENIDFSDDFWEGNNFDYYLEEPVRSGSVGGYSDITFINKNQDESNNFDEVLVFSSAKFYSKKSKKMDAHDIPKLCTLMQKHTRPNRKIKLILFVNDKQKAIDTFERQQSSSDILKGYITNSSGNYDDNIYDIHDLEKYYVMLKNLLNQYNYFETNEAIMDFKKKYLKELKPPFIPRFHQRLFIGKIIELLHKKINSILLGAIPRSGKSYMMAGTILEMVKTNSSDKYMKFIIITPAPNETFEEYMDIFNNYNDFDLLNIKTTKITDSNNIKFHPNSHNIIIISKQRLGWSKNDDEKTNDENTDKIIDNINKLIEPVIKDLSAIFLDEAHFGMSTDKAQQIVKILDKFKTIPKIYVTATYNKPLKVYGVTEESKLIWDLKDIKDMKGINSITLYNNSLMQKERFGKHIYMESIKSLGIVNDEEIIKYLQDEYSIYPEPYMITSIWNPDIINIEKKKIGNTNYGFDMGKLFMTESFDFTPNNKPQVIEYLRYYFGISDTQLSYNDQSVNKQFGIIPRIKRICDGKCRTMQSGHVTSQLWFLPTGGSGKIENRVIALLKVLNMNEFKKQGYHYYVAIEVKDKNKINTPYITYMKNSKEIKSEINNIVRSLKDPTLKYKKNSGDNLIILSGNRLQLGISLKDVDIVALWNNISSSDAIYQMLFRCMTEVDHTKKYGFMVDLNPQRVMTDVMLFGDNITYKKNTSNTDMYRQITDLINIDTDMLHFKYGDNPTQKQREDYINELFGKLYENWNMDVENTIKIAENFDYDDNIIKNISNELRKIRLSKKAKQTQDILDEPDDKIESGKKKEKVSKKDQDELTKELKKIEEIPIEKIAAELIGELISLLNIFTLYIEDNTKCILLNDENDKNININIITRLDILKDRVFNDKLRKKDFLQILNGRLGGDDQAEFNVEIIEKVIKSVSDKKDMSYIEKIIHAQKQGYYGIKDPVKLLEDINNNLAPKEKERTEKGEVFTPIYIVEDMLKQLHSGVWTNPYLKWLDPAVGPGNFPIIVYLKLMEGLKGYKDEKLDLTNEEKRRKHILEEMLYMVEISEKSIFILNKIFCGIEGGGKYTLNIFHGSFVEGSNYADINKPDPVYNPNFGFDVIMGNPPYNQGGVGKGGGVFWKKFVDKSLDILNENGYLTMIHPLGWRKPHVNGDKNSASKILFDMNNNGQLIYLNISDIKIKHFPKVDYYVYNKNININKPTIIDNKFKGVENKSNIDVKNLVYIPNFVNNNTIDIINKLNNKEGTKLMCIRDQYFKPNAEMKKRTSGIPHAFYYDVSKNDYNILYANLDEITGKGDKKLWKSPFGERSRIDDLKNPKVIMTYKAGNKPCNLYAKYYNNLIGLESNLMYMPVDNELIGNTIVTFLNSKLIRFILKITQYSESPNHTNEYKILNLITYPDKPLKTDQEIYEYYGINKTEQKLIEEIVDNSEKPKPKPKKIETKKKLVNTVSVPSDLFKTPKSSKSIKTFKKRNDPKNNGKQQIYNEKTKRWNTDTKANRKKILTQKK